MSSTGTSRMMKSKYNTHGQAKYHDDGRFTLCTRKFTCPSNLHAHCSIRIVRLLHWVGIMAVLWLLISRAVQNCLVPGGLLVFPARNCGWHTACVPIVFAQEMTADINKEPDYHAECLTWVHLWSIYCSLPFVCVCLSVCLAVCLPACLPACLPVCLSLSVCVCLYASVSFVLNPQIVRSLTLYLPPDTETKFFYLATFTAWLKVLLLDTFFLLSNWYYLVCISSDT